jgi:hypothetical protein
MNRKWNRKRLLTALLAISSTTLFTAAAQAQHVEGSFTLPYTVHWGLATLPAGNYTFEAPSSSEPFILTVRGKGTSAMIMAQGRTTLTANGSSLQIANEGNGAVVSSLQLAPYGLIFQYGSHRRRAVEMEASNRGSASSTNAVARTTFIDVPTKVARR